MGVKERICSFEGLFAFETVFVYIEQTPREREKEEIGQMRENNVKKHPRPSASNALLLMKLVGREITKHYCLTTTPAPPLDVVNYFKYSYIYVDVFQ